MEKDELEEQFIKEREKDPKEEKMKERGGSKGSLGGDAGGGREEVDWERERKRERDDKDQGEDIGEGGEIIEKKVKKGGGRALPTNCCDHCTSEEERAAEVPIGGTGGVSCRIHTLLPGIQDHLLIPTHTRIHTHRHSNGQHTHSYPDAHEKQHAQHS